MTAAAKIIIIGRRKWRQRYQLKSGISGASRKSARRGGSTRRENAMAWAWDINISSISINNIMFGAKPGGATWRRHGNSVKLWHWRRHIANISIKVYRAIALTP